MGQGRAGPRIADRLRRLVPQRWKSAAWHALANSPALQRAALGGDHTVRSAGLSFDLSGGHEHRAGMLRLGLYERNERFMVRRFIDGRRPVIELGSSIGVISCEIAKRVLSHRVICVEADPALARRTQANLRLNHFDDVTVEQAAISYSETEEVLFDADGGLGGHVSSRGTISVPATTLSALLDRHRIEIFDLVIDIEGAEADLFMHDRKALMRCRTLLIELDAVQIGGLDELTYIENLGFTLLYHHEGCAAFLRAEVA